MHRRSFLTLLLATVAPVGFVRSRWLQQEADFFEAPVETQQRFYELLDLARWKGWDQLPIGRCMGEVGKTFLGTPYVAGTLEGPGEVCRINLQGVDCVTFFEYLLGFARTLKKGKAKFEDFARELVFIRYRNGQLGDYTSRLHYMSDWILDNVRKGVVKDITAALGGKPYHPTVSFMSHHPDRYPALKQHPELVAKMQQIEQRLSNAQLFFIPQSDVAAIEPKLQTGDILAFTTSIQGLDYGHTGIVYRADGAAYLLHASTEAHKVFMDTTVASYLAKREKFTGVTVVRPLEPV